MAEVSGSIVWVAWMSRWGDATPEDAYAEGVYTDPALALKKAEAEASWRGMKYKMQHAPAYIDLKRFEP